MSMSQVFPVRLLGFGLYWAWLFLVTVSPSPLFGSANFASLPAESIELFFRLLFVVIILAMGEKMSSPRGRTVLVALCCLGGSGATILYFFFHESLFGIFAIVLIGLVDALIFVLWLCFFGHMKVGETALYMALSYCIGGFLCIGIQAIGGNAAVLTAAALPTISGLTFHFSNKLYAKETGLEELFSAQVTRTSTKEEGRFYPLRLGIALACTAFMFGSTTSCLYFGSISSIIPGPLIESGCCVALAVICGAIMLVTKQTQDLCVLYKTAPTILVAGAVVFFFGAEQAGTLGTIFVYLGYLIFEITALNDCCIAAKSHNLSLVKTFCFARIAITGGLLLGWAMNVASYSVGLSHCLLLSVGIALVVTVFSSTVIFTDQEIATARYVATEQKKTEQTGISLAVEKSSYEQDVRAFALKNGLSERETEVAEQALKGRSTSYIAKILFISSSTVKTHMHNIYGKAGVHSKMELLDAFEEFREENS